MSRYDRFFRVTLSLAQHGDVWQHVESTFANSHEHAVAIIASAVRSRHVSSVGITAAEVEEVE